MSNVCGIYAIKNTINGRCYFGSTVDWPTRRRRHICDLKKNKHHCEHLQRAWNKYGEQAFEFIFIYEVPKEHLLAAEQACIDMLPNQYNSSKHARMTFLGRGHSQNAIEKMRRANVGRIVPDELRERLRQANLGKKHTPEHRAKVSAAGKGRVFPDARLRNQRRKGYSWNKKCRCWTVRIWHRKRELLHALVDTEIEARELAETTRGRFDSGQHLWLPDSSSKRIDLRSNVVAKPRECQGYHYAKQISRWRVRGKNGGCYATEEEAKAAASNIRNGGVPLQAVAI